MTLWIAFCEGSNTIDQPCCNNTEKVRSAFSIDNISLSKEEETVITTMRKGPSNVPAGKTLVSAELHLVVFLSM